MTHQHHRETGGAGTGGSGLKAGAGMVFAQIGLALRMGLESLWRFGVRPPLIPSGPNQFPSLTFVELEPIVPGDGTGAIEFEPFPVARSFLAARKACRRGGAPTIGEPPYVGR